MSERLERAGRVVVDQPASSPLEPAELERRVSWRRTRRTASLVVCVALVGVVGATVVALNGGDDDVTQPIVTDGPTTVPAPSGIGDTGVLVRDGSAAEARVVTLDGEAVGTVSLTDPLRPEPQYFVHEAANGDLDLDTRDRRVGTDSECSYVHGLVAVSEFRVCPDRIWATDSEGNQHEIVGVPEAETDGHWGTVLVSPDGATLLAEFIGECDDPATYFVSADGSSVQGVTGPQGSSAPVGWIDNVSAVVSAFGRCGQPFDGPAGAVVITPAGVPNVLYEAANPDDFDVALRARVDDAGTAATQRAREAWVAFGADDYSFDYKPRCFCDNTPVHVVVQGERVSSVRSLENDEELSVANYAGIKQLIDRIAYVERDREAGAVEVLYDERGVPIEASIDTLAMAIDDEYAWTLSNLVIESHSLTFETTTPMPPVTVPVAPEGSVSAAEGALRWHEAGLMKYSFVYERVRLCAEGMGPLRITVEGGHPVRAEYTDSGAPFSGEVGALPIVEDLYRIIEKEYVARDGTTAYAYADAALGYPLEAGVVSAMPDGSDRLQVSEFASA